MTNAASEKGIAKRKRQAEADRTVDRTVIVALMSQVDGRRWVWLRLAEAQIFEENENLDPQYMAFATGRRNSGLRLLRAVNRYTPAMYIRMTEENTGVDLSPDPEPESENEDG